MKQRFVVSASYTGGCCASAHILVSFLKTSTEKAARDIVRKRLQRGGWEVGDMVVFSTAKLGALFKESGS